MICTKCKGNSLSLVTEQDKNTSEEFQYYHCVLCGYTHFINVDYSEATNTEKLEAKQKEAWRAKRMILCN